MRLFYALVRSPRCSLVALGSRQLYPHQDMRLMASELLHDPVRFMVFMEKGYFPRRPPS